LSWCQALMLSPWPKCFQSDNCDFLYVGRLLLREDGSVIYSHNCFWVDLARAVSLRSKSRRTHDHILLSHSRLAPPRGPGPRFYIPNEQGDPVILRSTVSQPVCSGIRPLSGNRDKLIFSFPWNLFLGSCWFLIMERPHWRENVSVTYSCCWCSPAQSFSVESRWTHDHISLSQCWDFFIFPLDPVMRPRVCPNMNHRLETHFIAAHADHIENKCHVFLNWLVCRNNSLLVSQFVPCVNVPPYISLLPHNKPKSVHRISKSGS
jgi:hypothetical protein